MTSEEQAARRELLKAWRMAQHEAMTFPHDRLSITQEQMEELQRLRAEENKHDRELAKFDAKHGLVR